MTEPSFADLGYKPKSAIAVVSCREDAREVTLQIDFAKDTAGLDPECELATGGLALTLSIHKNGDPPTVSIWAGNGEHDFGGESVEQWREYAEIASGNRPLSSYGECRRHKPSQTDGTVIRFPENPGDQPDGAA